MKQEIERKFLVANDGWRNKGESVLYRQGYIARTKDRIVRVRMAGDKGLLTVKIRTGSNLSRDEYEYTIPSQDAQSLLDSLSPGEVIEKLRHTFTEDGVTWEVDEFLGMNAGLVMAEIELDAEDQEFPRPQWLGEEVSRASRYLNVELAQSPYRSWQEPEKGSL